MTVRDQREAKGLSQIAVAQAMGVTESTYQRIESASAKTTDKERAEALKAIKSLKATGRKMVGRPFKDAARQAAVTAARANGTSVTAALNGEEDLIGTPVKATAPKAAKTSKAKTVSTKSSKAPRAAKEAS